MPRPKSQPEVIEIPSSISQIESIHSPRILLAVDNSLPHGTVASAANRWYRFTGDTSEAETRKIPVTQN
jgi:hypothetical protein